MKLFNKPLHIKRTHIEKVSLVATTAIATVLLNQAYTINKLNPMQIYNKTVPSIVTVTTKDLKQDPFSPRQLIETNKGIGTGFYYKSDKYIITNAHVVEGALEVKINDDEEIAIIGIDRSHDIAILETKTPHTPLTKCLTQLQIGQPVLAIGNPFGFEKTLTSGIISGHHRVLNSEEGATSNPLINLIQTDAAINPGSSGGVLLDAEKGCILGMNTAIMSPSGASAGLGFAIPITTIDEVFDHIINNEPSHKLTLGITLLPDTYSDMLGITGVIIADVVPDSPADHLGLQGVQRDDYDRPILGDIVVGINDTLVKKKADLLKELEHIKDTKDIKDIRLYVLKKDGDIQEYTIQ